ncbi:MAG TPA: VOC family protein [Gaiellaceae bacterium]|jgi:predicted enzyme related to lactoylglutathione lyase
MCAEKTGDRLTFSVEIFPLDLNRFIDFYVRVLRFELEADRRHEDSPYVVVRRGSARIGANAAWERVEPEKRAVPQGVELVFEVDDVVAERDAVLSTGWSVEADITRRPWGLLDFRLFDPDGHYIRITEPRP